METGEGGPEQILGVLSSLRFRLTDYDLIFTNRRMLAAKIGSSGVAQLAAGLVGVAASLARQDGRRSKYEGIPLDRVLAMDAKNFEVPYDAVRSGRFNAGISAVTVPMLKLRTDKGKVFFVFMKS